MYLYHVPCVSVCDNILFTVIYSFDTVPRTLKCQLFTVRRTAFLPSIVLSNVLQHDGNMTRRDIIIMIPITDTLRTATKEQKAEVQSNHYVWYRLPVHKKSTSVVLFISLIHSFRSQNG